LLLALTQKTQNTRPDPFAVTIPDPFAVMKQYSDPLCFCTRQKPRNLAELHGDEGERLFNNRGLYEKWLLFFPYLYYKYTS